SNASLPQEQRLKVFAPLDNQGRFTEAVKEFAGQHVFKANTLIVERLKERGLLVGEPGKLTHSYPHCWRCKNPVIFRATEQWFISMDSNGAPASAGDARPASAGAPLRQRALAQIKRVTWHPKWGEERISLMIENRPDWCISRQRLWGVPITVLY